MNSERLNALLERVARGETAVSDALSSLRDLPYADLGHTRIDHHRALRQGFAEVVYAAGKSPGQVADIVVCLDEKETDVLCTRASEATFTAVRERTPAARYHDEARCITVQHRSPNRMGHVTVVSAGTSDGRVASEAALCASFFGAETNRLNDVGVAGLHRLLQERERLQNTDVIIVVAGMEGALPSVIGGLVPQPVIAVPTSVGYGANLGGLTTLHAMLSSCAAGVSVVNIDNGFGAAVAATRILQCRPAG